MATLTPLQASSTLVNVAENAESHLVHMLAQNAPKNLLGSSFTSDCNRFIASGDAASVLQTVVKDQGAIVALVAMNPLQEAVSAFSLLASLLGRIPDANTQASLSENLADVIGNKHEKGDPSKRIAMLSALYNLRSDGTEKARLLSIIATLAAKHNPKMLGVGQPMGELMDADTLVKYMDFWGVPVTERRKLYRAAIASIVSLDRNSARKQKLLLLLVHSYGTEIELDVDARAPAVEAAVGAIRDPVTLISEQRNMMSMPAIVALSKDSATKPLYSLLQIFAEGKLEDYKTFEVTSPKVFVQHDLSKEECIRHMRLLSLCSLASEHEEVPYSAIAATLQIDDCDVEKWVIEAVSTGLISAKMDQLQKVVMIEQCVVRKFGIEQWSALQMKLHAWRNNVKTVLSGLEKSHVVQEFI